MATIRAFDNLFVVLVVSEPELEPEPETEPEPELVVVVELPEFATVVVASFEAAVVAEAVVVSEPAFVALA